MQHRFFHRNANVIELKADPYRRHSSECSGIASNTASTDHSNLHWAPFTSETSCWVVCLHPTEVDSTRMACSIADNLPDDY